MVKNPATYPELINKLIEHGCKIHDREQATQLLSEVGYYRLSAYFLPFLTSNKRYAAGTEFLKVYRVYEFDRKLRNLLFSAVEEVEINLRSKLSYYHAHKYGSLGYLDISNYNQYHNHQKFIDTINREIHNNQQLPFVQHHMTKYGGQFPLWAVMELFTFGMLSYFFADLPIKDQKQIAKECYSTTSTNVKSWLRCCTDLRNICAHYGRLYYRIFTAIPANIVNANTVNSRRLFAAILAVKAMFPDHNKWVKQVAIPLEVLIEEYREDISLVHIGFPEDWIAYLNN